MCLKIFELNPRLELAWEEALKKAKVELELLTEMDMLLMVEKDTRSGICHYIHRYV